MSRPVVPERVRDYLYPIALAVIPLLTAYGVVSDTEAPLYAALAAAVLGVGTATAYRPSRTGPGRHRDEDGDGIADAAQP